MSISALDPEGNRTYDDVFGRQDLYQLTINPGTCPGIVNQGALVR
jgi:hypothetical protein